ncbi:MAG: hypothetical protein KAI26_07705 [Nanoarchaeota archaeon]|nr:hypothetical protein [Nanoarchaeota archaeon]
MKLLILGSNGILGHALRKEFPEAIAWDSANLNIADENAVFNKIMDCKIFERR